MNETGTARRAAKLANVQARLAKLTANTGATPGPTHGMRIRAEVEAFDQYRNDMAAAQRVQDRDDRNFDL